MLVFLAELAAEYAISYAIGYLTKKKKPVLDRRDLGDTLSDPSGYVPVVYGTARVPAQIAFRMTTADVGGEADGSLLWIVAPLGDGAITGVDGIYLDGHLAIDGNLRAVDNGATATNYVGYANAWVAYGTDGQQTVTPREREALSIAGSQHQDANHRRLRVVAHPFAVGDCVATSGNPGLLDGAYVVTNVPDADHVDVLAYGGGANQMLGDTADAGGTIDYYTPDLPSLFPDYWTTDHRGRGVAYLVVRCKFHPDKWPNGVPHLEAVVRGRAIHDPRSVTTLTVSAVAVGPALGPYSATADLTITGHGLSEGDLLVLAGTTVGGLDGTQRVDRVVDANTVRCCVPIAAGATPAAATAEKLTFSHNPIACLRDYMTSTRYGGAVPTSELDDTALVAEMDYCDTLVWAPKTNLSALVTNRKLAITATPDGADTIITTGDAFFYDTGSTVLIADHPVAAVNGRWTITKTGPTTFTIPVSIAVGGTGGSCQEQIQQAIYAVDGVLDTSQTVQTCLEDLLSAARASLIYQQGTFRTFTRRAVTPVSTLTITEDVLVSDVTGRLPGASELANVVTATFRNAAAQYRDDTVVWPGPTIANDFLPLDNNQVLQQDLSLPMTTNRARAQQICMVARRESRHQTRLIVTGTEALLSLQIGDVVPVTLETPQYTNALYWVEGPIEIRPDATVALQLCAYDAADYDLDAADDIPFQAADQAAPDTLPIPTVTFTARRDGTIQRPVTYLAAQYVVPNSRYFSHLNYLVQSRPIGSATAWTSIPAVTVVGGTRSGFDQIPILYGIEAMVQVVAVNTSGETVTAAAQGPVTVGDNPAPEFTIDSATTSSASVTWTGHFDEDAVECEIYYQVFASDPGAARDLSGPGVTPQLILRRRDAADPQATDAFAVVVSISASSDYVLFTALPLDRWRQPGPAVNDVQHGRAAPAPTAPVSASAGSATTTSLVVSVTLASPLGSPTPDHIRLYRNGALAQTNAGTYSAGQVVPITDSGLAPGQTYSYAAKTVSGGIESTTGASCSGTTIAGTLDAPTNLVVTRSGHMLSLTWDPGANNPGSVTYDVELDDGDTGSWAVIDSGLTSPSDSVLTVQATARVRVIARAAGWTASSYTTSGVV